MEAQQRGYAKTIHNATEAISLSQTMGGAYQEVTHIMQRMRELVVQAGNETLNTSDRSAIEAELEELKDEIDHIGGLQFNSKELFGEGFQFHLATDSNVDVGLNIKTQQLAADRLGHQVVINSIEGVDASTNLSTGQISITTRSGETYDIRATADSDDELSTQGRAASALAKAAAINSGTELHGITARALKTEVTGLTTQATTLDQNNYLKINNAVISGFDVVESDVDGALIDAVNAVSEETGVVASHNAQGQVVLVAEDGRNIAIEAIGNGVNTGFVNGIFGGRLELQSDDTFTMSLSADAVHEALGKLTPNGLNAGPIATYGIADGSRSITGQNGSGIDGALAANFTVGAGVGVGSVLNVDVDEADDFNLKTTGDLLTFGGNGDRSLTLNHTISADHTTTISLNLLAGAISPGGGNTTRVETQNGTAFERPDAGDEIFVQTSTDGINWVDQGNFGANQILPATDNVGDSDAQRLLDARRTIVVTEAVDYEVRIIQKVFFGVSYDHFGVVFGEVQITPPTPDPLVFGENYSSSVETISVSTQEEADRALQIIDQALAEVTDAQVTLGALQNRLESTIRSMDQAKANLATAQSRIVDADLAVESSTLAQQQIVQQAGVSILAQANQLPSIALRLIA